MSTEQHLPIVRLLIKCPLCDSNQTHTIRAEKNGFPDHMHPEVRAFNNSWSHLARCEQCSFAFVREIPYSPTFFSNRYDNGWFDPQSEIESDRKSLILEDIFKHLKKLGVSHGKLLDVGCFAGKLLSAANKNGFSPEGIEINPKLVNYVKSSLKFPCYCGEFQSVELPRDNYQVITIIDVLEHLTEPKIVLANLVVGLRLGGLLYIKVPNYPIQILKQNLARFFKVSDVGICSNFGHINHFNVECLSKVLSSLGLEVLHVQMARSEYWQGRTLLFRCRNSLRDLYYRFSNVLYALLGIGLGPNLIVVARKSK